MGVKLFNVNIAEEVVLSDQWMGEHTRTIHRWTITIEGTNYRCVITECPCGLRRQLGVVYKRRPANEPRETWHRESEIERVTSVALTNCTCKSDAHRGSKPSERDRVCHGWHRARVDKLFAEIAKNRPEPKAAIGIPRGSLQTRFVGAGYVHRDARLAASGTPQAYRDELIKSWSTLVETAEVPA